jgi:hypothetical protein
MHARSQPAADLTRGRFDRCASHALGENAIAEARPRRQRGAEAAGSRQEGSTPDRHVSLVHALLLVFTTPRSHINVRCAVVGVRSREAEDRHDMIV